MSSGKLNLLLADDDSDDCIFFREALDDLPIDASLNTVNDGVELMLVLHKIENPVPDVLYLDLNMPRKSGFDCLSEIKSNSRLEKLPVIIFSTSFDPEVVNILQEKGAMHYIRKPGEFGQLKKIIFKSLNLVSGQAETGSSENFILTA